MIIGHFHLLSGEQQFFVYIFDPAIRWIDFYAIHQLARENGKFIVCFFCDDHHTFQWSPWMNILFFLYVPRISALEHASPQVFIPVLKDEIYGASLIYGIFQFDILWKGATVHPSVTPGQEFKLVIKHRFFGDVSVPSYMRPELSRQSPFFACFRKDAPH
jgi:hypothetical protein